MFSRLRESHRSAERKFVRTGIASVAVHATVILGGLYSLRSVAHHGDTVRADTTVVFLSQPQAVPALEALELAIPRGFQTVVPPAHIPDNLLPIDVQQHFDPRDYTGTGAEGGTQDGAAAPDGGVYSTAGVDEAPLLLSPPPAYPELGLQAGIDGRVLVQGVVDTTGRLEPASIKILQSPGARFEQTTRQWALKARFRPARVQGRAVRVLVRQPVDYSGTATGG